MVGLPEKILTENVQSYPTKKTKCNLQTISKYCKEKIGFDKGRKSFHNIFFSDRYYATTNYIRDE